uniref:Hydroxyproline O-arabinosyltransferase-like domain-containing protein n=1 Tax=Phytophthora ramorum TaxID=164328 RepID=H3GZ29_PHYRM
MLPQRQNSGKRATASHRRTRVTTRNAALVALGLIFALYMYFNLRFFATSTVSTNSIEAAGKGWRSFNGAPAKPDEDTLVDTSATRQVQHLVFTSTCRNLDFVHAEVLAFTLRRTGYSGNVTHLLYGCTSDEASEFVRKKDSRHNVQTRLYADISATNTTFGEKLVTTTLNPVVLAKWMLGSDGGELGDDRAVPFEERYALQSDDFVMAVDSDAIFTKKLDMWNLMAEANDVIDARIFGQDASWYWPNRFPLTHEQLTSILPTNSRALLLDDWREYAAIAPFVAEVSAWQEILPTAVDLWGKLAHEQRYLAVPIAAAHEKAPIGVSGVLSVHHYPSRYQNWDFVDDIKHNPCTELAEGKNLALSSYPISIRALNFTLPQWIDGRDWSFFADHVPSDFLSCDAYMMHQPTGYLWHLATHTSGYERVPNILRRRHTMSVCLAVEAYNSASESYRSHICPTGFNHNRRIPMEFQKETWSTAVALAKGTPMEEDTPIYFGDYKRKKASSVPHESDLKPGQEGSDELHFVFTTSCEPHQDWQSEALAQSFARVGQRGALTRVVSGCSDDAVKELMRRTQKSSPHLRIHVTRDFRSLPTFKEVSDEVEKASTPDDYAPYNKPFGLRDWLESANPPVREELVVVLDPDFLFIRPFAVNTGGRVTTAKGVDSGNHGRDSEVVEGMRQYKRFFVYAGSRDVKNVSDTVTDGVAVAQRWSEYLGTAAFENSSSVCPECAKVSKADAAEYYAVGPPYAITRKDLTQLMDDYCNMTVLKREQMKREHWMSEMLGYSLAAAKHKVKHTTFDNLALGNKADDYSGFVSIMKGNPCEDPVEPIIPGEAPPLLHGCHSYEADDDRGLKWMFYKQLMPNDMFACDSWLLASPPASVWTLAKRSRDKQRMLEAYGVCTSVKVFNQALVDFKTKMCPDGFNQNRRLRLVKDVRQDLLKVGQVHAAWQDAAQENVRERR